MALGLGPTYTISLNTVDNDGKKGTTEIRIPSATTAAAAVTFAAAIVPLAAAILSTVVTGYNLILSYVESAPGAPGTSDVEDKGVFNFVSANGQKTSIALPGILESVLQGNNADIDLSNADVDDFVTAMTAGLSGTSPANAAGSDLVSVLSAYKQNRRSHKSGGTRKG